jgi:hypothetical protein
MGNSTLMPQMSLILLKMPKLFINSMNIKNSYQMEILIQKMNEFNEESMYNMIVVLTDHAPTCSP